MKKRNADGMSKKKVLKPSGEIWSQWRRPWLIHWSETRVLEWAFGGDDDTHGVAQGVGHWVEESIPEGDAVQNQEPKR